MAKRKIWTSLMVVGPVVALYTSATNAAVIVTPTVVESDVALNGENYDVVDFNITSLTGADNTSGPGGAAYIPELQVLTGTFTANNGDILGVPGDSGTDKGAWQNYITDTQPAPTAFNMSGYPVTYGATYANFDSYASGGSLPTSRGGTGTATVNGSGTHATVSAIGGDSATLYSNWYTNASPSAGDYGPNPTKDPLLAQVLVTPGGGVSFAGTYTDYGVNTGAITFSYTATAIPEPLSISTFSLIGGSLLLRRRRYIFVKA